MDTARVTTFGTMIAIPHISKRFAMKRFLGLTAEEVAENEELWKEENGLSAKAPSASSELRTGGITSGGMQGDLDNLGAAGELPPDQGGAEAAGAAMAPDAGGTPTA
jgi:hypothetical protein